MYGRRITPAYAGNTFHCKISLSVLWDHPRLRGEHVPVCQTSVTSLGSPPPTRGTLSIREELVKDFRITPAYAGNTGKKYFTCFPSQDHPRLRGEHSHEHNQYFLTSGSPPPTRGTLDKLLNGKLPLRITPAYAGNTLTMHWLLISQRDHPRLRGEHLELIGSNNINVGSPPPTRGTPEKMVLDIYSHRITPAYAGNTCRLGFL